MKRMNAKEIVEDYLKRNGFDGLAGVECSCEIGDLMPCDEFGSECRPGYRIKCQPRTCAAGGGCEFHMSTRKPR